MSQESLVAVVERASTDATFRAELARGSAAALDGYDLTPAERAALLSGDAAALQSLGVDVRLSKFGGGYWDTQQGPFAADA